MASETMTTAASSDGFEIPLIDFSAFLDGDTATKTLTAKAILGGFQSAGFIYLRNHGISKPAVATAFSESAKFFARSRQQKDALAWTTPEANRGYSQPGREKTTDANDPQEIARIRATEGVDLKETFEIGREGEPGLPNQWPDKFDKEGEEFRMEMLKFHDQCKQLHVQVMRAIAVGLGIGEHWFDGYCDRGDNTLRLLHYPEVAANAFQTNKNTVRAGAHTDYGSITCLFQDMAGGLQVLSPSGTYVDATPIEDTIVVNAGDLLARWSNDTIKSTKHRVVEPPTASEVHPPRYSIAYFCNPNFNRFIDAIPGTYDDTNVKKHPGVNRYVRALLVALESLIDHKLVSGDYIVQRLTATY